MHSLFHLLYTEANWTGLDFIIKDLPSVLILRITANQILINLLCCSYKYNWCLCRFIGKLYILLWTLLEILSVISIFVHKVFWIKLIVGFNNYEIRPWSVSLLFFLVFYFCRFCVVIWFFHPRQNGQWPPTSKDFYTRSYPLHYFLILILEKEPVFPVSMLSAKQGNYWYHFYNVFGMTRGLTGDWTRDLPHSKPALYH